MNRIATTAALAASLVTALSPMAGYADPAPQPPDRYGQTDSGPPPGYEQGYAYGDTRTPPPEGWREADRRRDFSQRALYEDRRYGEAAEHWAIDNCIARRAENREKGAIIGGLLGALIGSAAAGRHDRGTGAIVGGAAGALAGSAIGASETSPGCPPGYVVRAGAPSFYGPGFSGGYMYVAPPGYRPWIWYGGRWSYRPYPYHRYWYGYERRRHHWR